MNIPLIAAGSLALLAAAVHGVGGQAWVVKELSPETLPRTRFGGPAMTKTMIDVTWHITTAAFFTVGCSLLLAGTVLEGDTARAVAVFAAVGATGSAGVAMVLALATQPLRALRRHPGPIALLATAVLAWWGAL